MPTVLRKQFMFRNTQDIVGSFQKFQLKFRGQKIRAIILAFTKTAGSKNIRTAISWESARFIVFAEVGLQAGGLQGGAPF